MARNYLQANITKMKLTHYKYIFLIGLLLGGWNSIYAENTPLQSKTKTRLKAYYEKNIEDNKVISVILIQGSGKSMAEVANVEVGIFSIYNDEESLLANIYTDVNGEAILLIEGKYVLPKDEDGYSFIVAKFEGNDSLRSSKKQLKFMDLNVDLSFAEEDSLRYVVVKTTWTDPAGNIIDIEDIDIVMGVERLYSILDLEKSTTGADGMVKIEFPQDIPGDSIGSVIIQIKINEDRKFGTITRSAKIDWGTKVDYSTGKNGRSLFGDQAPMWMIIAVIIILAGAWFNFILAMIKVSRIKGLEPNQEENLVTD
jgi:hypothetical protein